MDDSRDRVDRDAVWDFLTTQAYWGKWRTREQFERQVDQAWRVVGAYRKSDGGQLGFARAFSDGVGSAYLADVFVLPEGRGHGVGKALVRVMVEEGPGRDFRWMLHTDDAHGLYRSFGFAEPDNTYMERPRPENPA
ncbi:Ribosomal protein S18 acetylase RimI [Saccharopolyspora kobensis]|uniref:Ribosomal protein S18 acetylase RimI n=1 Tax=Saccharopolyspora kobensis TaxID=146035 RepID=A0A1H6CYW9_9PSEU|nr:Ribosomal protein S18 acetylase RimI [Saccharopolyspora kobensis]SFD05044.1 Ribosomal protein S18 acetylase RimI [Saccharopolyspora kobensis]